MLVLLGSSKTVQPAGDGAPWPVVLDGPLTARRKELVAAAQRVATDAPDDVASAFFDASGHPLAAARAMALALDDAPTRPALERYHGPQWTTFRDAGVGDPSTVLVVSGLWGLVRSSDPIPAYRLPPGGRLPDGGVVAGWWGDAPTEALAQLAEGHDVVVDLLPAEFGTQVDVAAACEAAGAARVPVRFERADGRAVGSVRLKQARGAFAAHLSRGGTLNRFNDSPGVRWRNRADGDGRLLTER